MRCLVTFLIVGLILSFAGCGNQSTSPALPETTGFERQETPDDVRKLIDNYALPVDGESYENELAMLDSLPVDLVGNCNVYSVTFLWGDIFNTADIAPDTVDWSGRLSIYNGEGVVHVRFVIDFEAGQDSVLIHDCQDFAAWISKTCVDFDGLSFLVFIKWNNINPASVACPSLVFETEPITLRFSLYQLAWLDAFYRVDNIGAVAVRSRLIWQNVCPGGLIEGTWIKDGSFGDSGYFQGLWLDYKGEVIGLLSGKFWRDDNTNFLGKFEGWVSGVITLQIIAELKGYWFYDDYRLCPICGQGHGIFYGKFIDCIDGSVGRVLGEFGDYSLPPNDVEMPMHGIWYYYCPWSILDPAIN
jgi:hypothetical protein